MATGGAIRSAATKLCRLSPPPPPPSSSSSYRCGVSSSSSSSPPSPPPPSLSAASDLLDHVTTTTGAATVPACSFFSAAAQDPKHLRIGSVYPYSAIAARTTRQFASAWTRRFSSQLAPNESKSVVFVDTLALVRKLEAHGFTGNQAEAITSAITEVLNDCLDSVGHSFVSKADLEKSGMLQEAALLKLRTDMESSEEKKVSTIQRESEKVKDDIDKLKAQMRYEMDKVSAGQRLDLNLERGRMREELAKQSAETSNLTNKLNKEIHALKTQLEASKYEVIKYCIGTIVSVIALGLGLLRIFK